MSLNDTGDRTVFGEGAMRDMGEGKGRCDLLPLSVIGDLLDDDFFLLLDEAVRTKDALRRQSILKEVTTNFAHEAFGDWYGAILEVSKQYEDGAKKYSDRNWELGLPMYSFFDSAIRHYLKYLDGWTDEPHDRAVLWNLLGAMWYTDEEIRRVFDELDEELNKVEEMARELPTLEQMAEGTLDQMLNPYRDLGLTAEELKAHDGRLKTAHNKDDRSGDKRAPENEARLLINVNEINKALIDIQNRMRRGRL